MKQLLLLSTALIGGMACAVPEPVNVEQVDAMVHAFEHVATEMSAVQKLLLEAAGENAPAMSFAYDILCKKCEQLRSDIAQLGMYQGVPGFAKHCYELSSKWVDVLPGRYAIKKYRDIDNSHTNWFLGSAHSCVGIIYSGMIYLGCTNRWERENIQPYALGALGACTIALVYTTARFSGVDTQRDEFINRYNQLKEAYENGPKKRVQQIIDALIDMRPYYL
ncbi:MAG: hypothetical protein WCE21_01105 [Candidatus Babeliales bacterium]